MLVLGWLFPPFTVTKYLTETEDLFWLIVLRVQAMITLVHVSVPTVKRNITVMGTCGKVASS